jgi:hypothetical protein
MNYRERVRKIYRKHRKDNMKAKDALAIARFEARYEGGRKDVFIEDKTKFDLPFGFSFIFELHYDDFHESPWEKGDYSGVIKGQENHPGESYENWIISRGRGWYSYYDWKATLPRAIKDGWDSAPYGERDKQLRAMRAMKREYDHYRRWYDDQWYYMSWEVTLYDPEGKPIDGDSVGGYESDYMNYIVSEARNSAAYMLKKARRKFYAERGDGWRQRELELEEV